MLKPSRYDIRAEANSITSSVLKGKRR